MATGHHVSHSLASLSYEIIRLTSPY